jgi:hypothetical protein
MRPCPPSGNPADAQPSVTAAAQSPSAISPQQQAAIVGLAQS